MKKKIVLSPEVMEQFKKEEMLLVKGGVTSTIGDFNIICYNCINKCDPSTPIKK
jgi:hypothetical protein